MVDKSRIKLVGWAIWTVVLLTAACSAMAHPAPNSAVFIDIGEASVSVEIAIPLGELESALKLRVVDHARPTITLDSPAIAQYLLAHVGAHSNAGQAWSIQLRSLVLDALGEHRALVAKLLMVPPPGVSPRNFEFQFDAVTHEVMSHVMVVMLRSDFYNGKLADTPEFMGVLQYPTRSLRIDQGQGQSWLAGLGASFKLGLKHMAEGVDHLLFLLTLILIAPVVARNKKWIVDTGWSGPVHKILWVTAAFSLGHSFSLALGVALDWRFNSGPVELLVALSILITAVHAWHPCFPRWEACVAGGFGLIHGAALSIAISSYEFDSFAQTVALIGFTAGIETLQVMLVAVVLPALMILRASATFSWIRNTLIIFSAVAAIGWIIQRIPDGVS